MTVRTRALAIAFVVITTSVARADDDVPVDPPSAPEVDQLGVHDSGSLLHDPGKPQLELDLVPRPNILGLGVVEDTHRTAVTLFKRLTISASGTSWKGYADAVPHEGDALPRDPREIANGRSYGVGLSYDAGWLRLDASLSENKLSSQYGSGAYREVSLSISKTHRFSRWVTGFLSLSIARRTWNTPPPPGEFNSTYFLLSLGATFR